MYLVVFGVLLLMVAALSFVGLTHIQAAHSTDIDTRTVSSILKASEDKLIETAEQIISTSQHYIYDHMPSALADVGENFRSSDTNILTVLNKPAKKRLAYVITITKDGFFQDGAAVLAYSIMKYANATSYDISLIAFVHPNVTTSRVGLRRLGFHVIEVPTPVNTSAIQFPFLRDHIDKNGCCGAAELIKITSYR